MNATFVTGASGFVGRRLCADLIAAGMPLVAASRSGTDYADAHNIIFHFPVRTDMVAVLKRCRVVIHLAGRAHVMKDKEPDPLATYRALNVDATLALARQAAQAGVTRFVYVSSVKVNGNSTRGRPFGPQDKPHPEDDYGLSKWEAEQALQDWGRQSGMEIVVVRPPLIYGPGVSANFLRMMQLVKSGIPLPFGSVINKRSLIGISNLCDLLIRSAIYPAAGGQTLMVSDGSDVSTPELIRLIGQAMNRKPLLLPVPERWLRATSRVVGAGGSVERLLGSLQVDISPTMSSLAWKPIMNMETEVRRTVEHFLKRSGDAHR